jgi:hypothetical protein
LFELVVSSPKELFIHSLVKRSVEGENHKKAAKDDSAEI